VNTGNILPPGEPIHRTHDLAVYTAIDQQQQRSAHRLVDHASGTSRLCVRRLPNADSTALSLLAVHGALKSIEKSRVAELIQRRYGFRATSAALASGKRPKALITVSAHAIAEIGRTLAANDEDEDALAFLQMSESDRRVWGVALPQLRRFDVDWQLIDAGHQTLQEIDSWAADALGRALHDGPVFSRAMPTRKESEAA